MGSVTVVGRGAAGVVPDAAVVNVTAVHRARTLPEALAGAESAREALVEVARRWTDRIASQHLSVGRDDPGKPAYHARHSLQIRCAGLEEAGELVTALAEEVGDRLSVDHVGLEVTDTSAAEREARDAAFADARDKAEQLAAHAGGTLGAVESVTEGGMAGVPRFAAQAMTVGVGLVAGETSVEQTLTVTFELVR